MTDSCPRRKTGFEDAPSVLRLAIDVGDAVAFAAEAPKLARLLNLDGELGWRCIVAHRGRNGPKVNEFGFASTEISRFRKLTLVFLA